jgi:hypothetical protein
MPRVHRAIVLSVLSCLLPRAARAEVPIDATKIEGLPATPTQLQADLGLAVIGIGIEHAIAPQLAVQAEVFTTGTYFLPWFDLGPSVIGFGGGVRLTWLEHPYGRGLYGTALVRLSGVHTDGSDTFLMTEVGLAAGYAFPITRKLDLRLGLGVIEFRGSGAEHMTGTTDLANVGTPFVQLDAVLGYRL